MKSLLGSYKPAKCMTCMNTTTDTRGHIDCGSLQTCDQSLSLTVIVRENGCARGGQDLGRCTTRPFTEGVARPMSFARQHRQRIEAAR